MGCGRERRWCAILKRRGGRWRRWRGSLAEVVGPLSPCPLSPNLRGKGDGRRAAARLREHCYAKLTATATYAPGVSAIVTVPLLCGTSVSSRSKKFPTEIVLTFNAGKDTLTSTVSGAREWRYATRS